MVAAYVIYWFIRIIIIIITTITTSKSGFEGTFEVPHFPYTTYSHSEAAGARVAVGS